MAILKVGTNYFDTEHTSFWWNELDQLMDVTYLNGDRMSIDGEQAIALKRWLDKNSIDVMEE